VARGVAGGGPLTFAVDVAVVVAVDVGSLVDVAVRAQFSGRRQLSGAFASNTQL